MKRFSIFFTLSIIILIFSCSKSEEAEPGNNDSTISVNGESPVRIDTTQGQVINTYDVSNTISAGFAVTNFDVGYTLLINMNDDDMDSFPFTNNGTFPVGNDPIRSLIRFTEFGGVDVNGTSGSATVTEFRRIQKNNIDFVELSGTFTVSNGTDNIEGTFDNIQVQCIDCN